MTQTNWVWTSGCTEMLSPKTKKTVREILPSYVWWPMNHHEQKRECGKMRAVWESLPCNNASRINIPKHLRSVNMWWEPTDPRLSRLPVYPSPPPFQPTMTTKAPSLYLVSPPSTSLDFRAYSPWLYQNRDVKTIHTLPVDQMTGLFLQLCFFSVLIVAFIAALRDTFQAFDEGMSCTITIEPAR